MRKAIILFILFLIPSLCAAETIRDIFPDENVARYVRDEVGAISIDDEILQDKLDSVWLFGNFDGYGEIKDITGISRLGGLMILSLSCHWQSDVHLSALPDELFTMDSVTAIEMYYLPNLTSIQDEIGDMSQLTILSVEKCGITSIPDSICNLTNLTSLTLSGCPITALPENIGKLVNLEYLDISDTLITELPESIKNLTNLKTFNRSGTSL